MLGKITKHFLVGITTLALAIILHALWNWWSYRILAPFFGKTGPEWLALEYSGLGGENIATQDLSKIFYPLWLLFFGIYLVKNVANIYLRFLSFLLAAVGIIVGFVYVIRGVLP